MHLPVLLSETIQFWLTDKEGIYIDGTFGRGGHSQTLLKVVSDKAQLLALDQDENAVAYANKHIKDPRFEIIHGSFTEIYSIAAKRNLTGKVSGILLDIGVSSPQLDNAERGFSFMQDGPLDMRMDQRQPLDAKTWINQTKEEEMATIFKNYGDERFSKRIAHAICEYRKTCLITRTLQLAEIVSKANPNWEKHKHPATRVFQAIRIHINDELENLKKGLEQSLEVLKQGGRLVVITFHSLEDRIVKHYFKAQSQGTFSTKGLPKGLPLRDNEFKKKVKIITKPIKPSQEELIKNPRARSAVLRVVEKL